MHGDFDSSPQDKAFIEKIKTISIKVANAAPKEMICPDCGKPAKVVGITVAVPVMARVRRGRRDESEEASHAELTDGVSAVVAGCLAAHGNGYRRQSPFLRNCSYAARNHSMSEARELLARELRLLGARKEVLSTNVQLRLDGTPYSNRSQPDDTGAAVYFELKGRPVALACDKWLRVEDNVWSIGKHIESLRAQERWGVGSVEQAFRGYMALPAIGESSAIDWWKTLGVPVNAAPDQVRMAYLHLVKKHHPDVGGDPELFHRVQRAMERFESLQGTTEVVSHG